MTTMTQAEKETFLADVHVGVLSISQGNGSGAAPGPLTVPVWYDYEPGGVLWLITGAGSRKGRLLQEGKRVSLCAQTETAPYQYVYVEGPVTSIEPPGDAIRPMAIRYLGEAMGNQYADASGDGGDSVLVKMQPENWLAVDYNKS